MWILINKTLVCEKITKKYYAIQRLKSEIKINCQYAPPSCKYGQKILWLVWWTSGNISSRKDKDGKASFRLATQANYQANEKGNITE